MPLGLVLYCLHCHRSKRKAVHWAQAFLASHSMETLTSQLFIHEFQSVWSSWVCWLLCSIIPCSRRRCWRLLNLKQGWKFVFGHSIDFGIIAEETEWDELALKGASVNSLSEQVKDQLATREEPESLDELILMLCIKYLF